MRCVLQKRLENLTCGACQQQGIRKKMNEDKVYKVNFNIYFISERDRLNCCDT